LTSLPRLQKLTIRGPPGQGVIADTESAVATFTEKSPKFQSLRCFVCQTGHVPTMLLWAILRFSVNPVNITLAEHRIPQKAEVLGGIFQAGALAVSTGTNLDGWMPSFSFLQSVTVTAWSLRPEEVSLQLNMIRSARRSTIKTLTVLCHDVRLLKMLDAVCEHSLRIVGKCIIDLQSFCATAAIVASAPRTFETGGGGTVVDSIRQVAAVGTRRGGAVPAQQPAAWCRRTRWTSSPPERLAGESAVSSIPCRGAAVGHCQTSALDPDRRVD